MKYKKSLIEIIKKNKLCISENPFGIKRLWPYSYIEFFYERFCNDLYQRKKSPNILEVNQYNNLNIELWRLYFKNPRIHNINKEKIMQINFKDYFKYDIIILEAKYLIKNKIILNYLINLLNSDGIIVIENIGQKPKEVIKIYIKFFKEFMVKIFDFRLISFISNNCILVIKENGGKNNFLKKSMALFLLIKFLIIENIILFFKIIFKKINL